MKDLFARLKFILALSFPMLIMTADALAQSFIPDYYVQDKDLDMALKNIIEAAGLNSSYDAREDGMEQISFAVIDLNGTKPVLGGVNPGNFIYPASVYKMYVAMEVLRQVSDGKYSLYEPFVVTSPNDVDKSKEIPHDPRPLLKNGDTVTVNYLLDLMLTRSDNTAANCLIDLADRVNINTTMHEYGWLGSEITRKFLSRKYEDPGYDTIRGTETCALHAADFLYKVYTDQLVNPWVSKQMKSFLCRQLDTAKLAAGLPSSAMFYHKTGWWSYYTNDTGIVDDGKVKYIIALFTPVKEAEVTPQLEQVSKAVYALMKKRHCSARALEGQTDDNAKN